MSTTFGIEKRRLFEGEEDEIIYVEVAHRTSHGITWRNDLAEYLPDDFKIIPFDNSAQGIYTIGDIKKEIFGLRTK